MFPNRKVHGYTHIVVFVPIHTDGVRVNVDVYNPQERKVNQDMNGFSISKLIRFRSNLIMIIPLVYFLILNPFTIIR